MKYNKAKADARTAIYTVLFGKQEHTYLMQSERPDKRANRPEFDMTRRLSTFWSYANANEVYHQLVGLADFDPVRKLAMEARLAQLKHHKPRG